MQETPISTPAGFAAVHAIGFADDRANLALVSDTARLPVSHARPAPPPLEGQASFSEVVGPFEATAGRVLTLELVGDFTGTVQLLRSTDGGFSKLPLRVGGREWGIHVETGCEQVWLETVEGAAFFLDIALDMGSLTYKVAQ